MSEQIKFISLCRLTIGACAQFHDFILELIHEATQEALHIEDVVPEYERTLGVLMSVVNRRRKLAATHLVREADRRRCRAFGTIKIVVNGYHSSIVEENRMAAILLTAELAAYRGIHRHAYTKKNAEMDSMLRTLDQPENAAAIATLGLTREVEALRRANEESDEAFRMKTDELGELHEQRSINSREVMERLNAQYEHIVQRVNAYALIQPSEAVLDFVHRANGVVIGFSDLAD